jgi:hypothetical protein
MNEHPELHAIRQARHAVKECDTQLQRLLDGIEAAGPAQAAIEEARAALERIDTALSADGAQASVLGYGTD